MAILAAAGAKVRRRAFAHPGPEHLEMQRPRRLPQSLAALRRRSTSGGRAAIAPPACRGNPPPGRSVASRGLLPCDPMALDPVQPESDRSLVGILRRLGPASVLAAAWAILPAVVGIALLA